MAEEPKDTSIKKIDQIKFEDTGETYDIDLPADATPNILSISAVSGYFSSRLKVNDSLIEDTTGILSIKGHQGLYLSSDSSISLTDDGGVYIDGNLETELHDHYILLNSDTNTTISSDQTINLNAPTINLNSYNHLGISLSADGFINLSTSDLHGKSSMTVSSLDTPYVTLSFIYSTGDASKISFGHFTTDGFRPSIDSDNIDDSYYPVISLEGHKVESFITSSFDGNQKGYIYLTYNNHSRKHNLNFIEGNPKDQSLSVYHMTLGGDGFSVLKHNSWNPSLDSNSSSFLLTVSDSSTTVCNDLKANKGIYIGEGPINILTTSISSNRFNRDHELALFTGSHNYYNLIMSQRYVDYETEPDESTALTYFYTTLTIEDIRDHVYLFIPTCFSSDTDYVSGDMYTDGVEVTSFKEYAIIHGLGLKDNVRPYYVIPYTADGKVNNLVFRNKLKVTGAIAIKIY